MASLRSFPPQPAAFAPPTAFPPPPPSKSPLASSTPPPVSLPTLRRLAAKAGATLPVGMLEAMRTMLMAQGQEADARELEALFDLTTGCTRLAPPPT